METRRAVGNAAGFTLIEAMISMFFIAFIVGEMAMVSTYARRSTNYARRFTEANMIAEGVLEKARNAAYVNLPTPFSADLAVSNPPDPIVFDLDKDGIVESYNETCALAGLVTTCTAAAQTYTVTRTVTPYRPNAATPFLNSTAADIDVVVSWLDDRAVGHQVRVTTVRTKF